MSSINNAVKFCISNENIKNKQDLLKWFDGRGYQKLYNLVRAIAPQKWSSIRTPENSVRWYTQCLVQDYKNYKN